MLDQCLVQFCKQSHVQAEGGNNEGLEAAVYLLFGWQMVKENCGKVGDRKESREWVA